MIAALGRAEEIWGNSVFLAHLPERELLHPRNPVVPRCSTTGYALVTLPGRKSNFEHYVRVSGIDWMNGGGVFFTCSMRRTS